MASGEAGAKRKAVIRASRIMKKKIKGKKYRFAIIVFAFMALAAAGLMKFPRQPAAKAAGTNLNFAISPTLPWRMTPPVVFNNKLWIIGGYGGEPISDYLGNSLYNDVWSSSDGVTR